eukprot:Awhi_evm2s2864
MIPEDEEDIVNLLNLMEVSEKNSVTVVSANIQPPEDELVKPSINLCVNPVLLKPGQNEIVVNVTR